MIEAGEERIAGGVVKSQSRPDSEGEQFGGTEPLGESRVADEDDAQQLFAVEFLAGQDAQLAEDGGESLLGLVD